MMDAVGLLTLIRWYLQSELQRQHRAIMEDYRILQDKQREITQEISLRKEQVADAQRG